MQVKPGTTWDEVAARAHRTVPEAYDDGRLRNLVGGRWQSVGVAHRHAVPVDGTYVPGPPMLERADAAEAVEHALVEHRDWATVGLDDRLARVAQAVDGLAAERELLALLLAWEIGKPWRLAQADVDRGLAGARWYLGQIERQLHGRCPLPGPVSNIASWNYPVSVQVHAELVQLLAGNAVLAKTPTQGGFHCLTVAHAIMRRAGLPVNLLSGAGSQIGDVLIRHDGIGALAFVGGRTNGRSAAAALTDAGMRHMIELEGLNAWGVWDFSQWDLLHAHLRKGFEYAKQRCTAYPRYVVQRRLFPEFLRMYLAVVDDLRFGHPLAVEHPDDPLPDLDFGPVISRGKAARLGQDFEEAVRGGAVPLVRRTLAEGRFVDGQDTDAYVAPACLLSPPPSWTLHHSEPFGPLDSIVLVDTEPELLAAMNASNGSLVASVASDDLDFAARVAEQLQAFKVGVNTPRSRGDREEPFGGRGASWKGAFVGGDLLVDAVTRPVVDGPDRLFGNFAGSSRYPPT